MRTGFILLLIIGASIANAMPLPAQTHNALLNDINFNMHLPDEADEQHLIPSRIDAVVKLFHDNHSFETDEEVKAGFVDRVRDGSVKAFFAVYEKSGAKYILDIERQTPAGPEPITFSVLYGADHLRSKIHDHQKKVEALEKKKDKTKEEKAELKTVKAELNQLHKDHESEMKLVKKFLEKLKKEKPEFLAKPSPEKGKIENYISELGKYDPSFMDLLTIWMKEKK